MPTLRLLPELEDALRHIQGVRAASVVTGPDAVPTEVHVLADPGKPAKQVVRDVQSLAMARYDIDIDHRIVSVVQMGDDEVRAAPAAPAASRAEQPEVADLADDDGDTEADGDDVDGVVRPAIAAIMVRSGKGETEASVTLATGDQLFEGRSQGPAGASHRARLVAVATLDAVAELLGQPCEVESSTIVATGTREVALTVLTMVLPRTGEQILTGCAAVRGDEADAVARSVLAALNRQLAG
jgi:MoxR-like ATPase